MRHPVYDAPHAMAAQGGSARSEAAVLRRSWEPDHRGVYARPAGERSAALTRPAADRSGLAGLWRSFIDETSVRLATLWPGSFVTRAWQRRFVVTGLERVLDCQAARRPVVLAVIHAHHVNLIQLFLRAHGVPIASLTYLNARADVLKLRGGHVELKRTLSGWLKSLDFYSVDAGIDLDVARAPAVG